MLAEHWWSITNVWIPTVEKFLNSDPFQSFCFWSAKISFFLTVAIFYGNNLDQLSLYLTNIP